MWSPLSPTKHPKAFVYISLKAFAKCHLHALFLLQQSKIHAAVPGLFLLLSMAGCVQHCC